MADVESTHNRIWIPQAIASGLLLLALNPSNPYGYYVLLRIICCACFVYLAYRAHHLGRTEWIWIFSVTAAVYNPLIRIHLTREFWSAVNIATIGLAIGSIFNLKQSKINE